MGSQKWFWSCSLIAALGWNYIPATHLLRKLILSVTSFSLIADKAAGQSEKADSLITVAAPSKFSKIEAPYKVVIASSGSSNDRVYKEKKTKQRKAK
jgi:hypothetical protein